MSDIGYIDINCYVVNKGQIGLEHAQNRIYYQLIAGCFHPIGLHQLHTELFCMKAYGIECPAIVFLSILYIHSVLIDTVRVCPRSISLSLLCQNYVCIECYVMVHV